MSDGLYEILRAELQAEFLYDLMAATDGVCEVNNCMTPGYQCERRDKKGACSTQIKLMAVQRRLDNELRSCTLKSLLN